MGVHSKTPRTKENLEEYLRALVAGKIRIEGVHCLIPPFLDNLVLDLSGQQDGSVAIGTKIKCGRGVSAEVEMIGNKVYDGNVVYTVRFHYKE
jgi:hypothetical protein